MIYLDSSVALAHLMAEDRRPPDAIWEGPVITSRLLEYEVWNRLHRLGLTRSHHPAAEALLGRLAFVELLRPVLQRASEPFPTSVRTLDALHLASMDFLVRQGQRIRLASYDQRLNAAATKAGIELYPLN